MNLNQKTSERIFLFENQNPTSFAERKIDFENSSITDAISLMKNQASPNQASPNCPDIDAGRAVGSTHWVLSGRLRRTALSGCCSDLLCGLCQLKPKGFSREGFRVSGFRI